MPEKHYTYLLLTENNKLYCGYTNNLEKRFRKHVEGTASKYTRANKPVKFVYIEEHETKSEALKSEARIKTLNKKQKKSLINSDNNIIDHFKPACFS